MSELAGTDIWREEYPDIYDYHSFAPFYRELLDLAAGKFDDACTVVDAGGGTGNLARRLRDVGTDVVVVDLSRPMVANAREKLGGDGVGYVQADLNSGLPVTPGRIDGIAALNVVYLLDDPQAFLSEANRILRPGGTFVASGPKPDPDMWPLLRAVLGEFARNPSLGDFFGLFKSLRLQSRITEQLGDGELNGLTADDWERYLQTAGFDLRETESIYENQGYLVTARAQPDD
ncbi:MAG: class I SAM-dependent methyltransferase [Halobacteriota archaeon]